MDTQKVSRVEVIDDSGRALVINNADSVYVQLQDIDRTLKVFVEGRAHVKQYEPKDFDPAKAVNLPDAILAEAFRILWGDDWKKDWNDRSKAEEMRRVILGGDQPCRPFAFWVKVVDFISVQAQ